MLNEYEKNCYELFGLASDASQAEIKRARDRLALRWYPDRPGGNVEMMQKINSAYETLKKIKEDSKQYSDEQYNLGLAHYNGRGVKRDHTQAVHLFKLAAAQGHAEAQCKLAEMYAEGKGVTKDHVEAIRLYRLAIAQGNARAHHMLGLLHEQGDVIAKDIIESVRLYKAAVPLYKLDVDKGNAEAQRGLGWMYCKGKGVEQNYPEAVRLYKLAVAQGDESAQNNLGIMYHKGLGVERNYTEAARLYQLAIAQEHADAQLNLDRMYNGLNLNEQCNLALAYRQGRDVARNYTEAARLYQLAIAQGHARARTDLKAMYNGLNSDEQTILGYNYYHGHGVTQNYPEAVRLFKLAIAQGYTIAQNNLAAAYHEGKGVDRNYTEAARLYQLAIAQGVAQAQINLEAMYNGLNSDEQCTLGHNYYHGNGVTQNYPEAVRLYKLAVAQGHAIAQNNLGVAYHEGKGVDRDYTEAARLYQLAIAQGCAQAQINLAAIPAPAVQRTVSFVEATPSFRDVLAAATNVAQFYNLPQDRYGFDGVAAQEDRSHGRPEIAKMSYLYRYLEDNNYIPNTTNEIRSTITGLVAYAKTINEHLGVLPDSKRMFKLGVDRLLRTNERITQTEDWNGRALLLGLFRYIKRFEQNHPGDRDMLQRLNQAFIIGVRQVIEATTDDLDCTDPICVSAKTIGFFAGDREVEDLSMVYPHCHGRLKNLSVDLAVLLGYTETLGDTLIKLLTNAESVQHARLVAKMASADSSDPSTMTITGADRDLNTAGINNQIFGHLVQVRDGGLPDAVTAEQAEAIRQLLLPRPERRPERPECVVM